MRDGLGGAALLMGTKRMVRPSPTGQSMGAPAT